MKKYTPLLMAPLANIQKNQYVAAWDQYKRILNQRPFLFADSLISLYHVLQTREDDWYLRLIIAEMYVLLRCFSDALYELEELYEANPNFSQMYFLLGKIWAQTHDKRVLTLFESAFEREIYNSVILDILPQVYMSQENLDNSIRFFARLIQNFPENAHYHQTLADLYIKTGRYTDALPEYRALIEKSPMHAADVARRITLLLEQAPDSAPLHLFLVHLYSMLYDPDSCLSHLESLWACPSIDLFPEYERLGSLFPYNTRLFLETGRYLLHKERYSEGVDYLSQLYALSPQDHRDIIHTLLHNVLALYATQVYAHQLLIQIAMDRHQYQESLAHIGILSALPLEEVGGLLDELKKIISHAPDLEPESRLLMAQIYMGQEAYPDAIHHCEGISHTHVAPEAKRTLAQIYARQGRYDMSRDMLQAYYSLLPTLSVALMDTAIEIQKHQHRSLISAKPTPDTNADTAPDVPITQVGLMHAEAGHLHDAIVMLQKIPPTDTHSELAILTLCNAYLEQGKFEFALRHLPWLSGISQTHPQRHRNSLFLQAVAHTLLGDGEKAIDALETIVNQEAEFPYAPPMLTHLRNLPATHYRGRMLTWILTPSGPVLIAVPNENPADPMHLSLALPHQEKGVTYALKQQYTAGIEALSLAYQLAPDMPSAQINMAYIYAIQGHLEKANEVRNTLHGIRTVGALVLEAGLLDLAGDTKAALSLLSSSTRPTALCQINMGFLHWKLHEYDAAIALWEQALVEVPAFPFVARCVAPIRHILPDLGWLPPVFRFPKTW